MKRSLVTITVIGLLLTGCSASVEDSGSGLAEPASGSADRAVGAPEVAPDTQGGTGLSPAGEKASVPLGRVAPTGAVIRTGELEVVVPDVGKAADEAAALVRAARGQLEADDRARDQGPQRAVLRLRVPPASFDAVVRDLAALGEERSRRLGSEDVTEQVVDLDSRLATQRASVDRVRALLAQAKTLGEVVQVEAELTRRTADLESLQARLTALSAQVDLATINLRLTAQDAPGAAAGGPLGFGDGLGAGLDALRAVGRAAGVTAGALLPWSPLLLGLGLLAWRARRRPREAEAATAS